MLEKCSVVGWDQGCQSALVAVGHRIRAGLPKVANRCWRTYWDLLQDRAHRWQSQYWASFVPADYQAEVFAENRSARLEAWSC